MTADMRRAIAAIHRAMDAPEPIAGDKLDEAARCLTEAGRADLAAAINAAGWHEPAGLVADRVWNALDGEGR